MSKKLTRKEVEDTLIVSLRRSYQSRDDRIMTLEAELLGVTDFNDATVAAFAMVIEDIVSELDRVYPRQIDESRGG